MFFSWQAFLPYYCLWLRTGAYLRVENLKGSITHLGSGLTHIHLTRLEKPRGDKHSSFFSKFINYQLKKFDINRLRHCHRIKYCKFTVQDFDSQNFLKYVITKVWNFVRCVFCNNCFFVIILIVWYEYLFHNKFVLFEDSLEVLWILECLKLLKAQAKIFLPENYLRPSLIFVGKAPRLDHNNYSL